MRLYFGLTIVALGFTAVCGGAVSWDGSYVLFKVLDLQSPYVLAHTRLINIPFLWMVLFINCFTSDSSVLQIVYGLVYAVIPFVALAISWWVVRGYAQALFIWAALGVGLGTLPGQFCLVCEEISAISLFWPIILAILIRIRRHQVPVIVLFAIVIFFTHPVAIMLFAFGVILAFAIGIRSRDR
jgi:hypothetical protein